MAKETDIYEGRGGDSLKGYQQMVHAVEEKIILKVEGQNGDKKLNWNEFKNFIEVIYEEINIQKQFIRQVLLN